MSTQLNKRAQLCRSAIMYKHEAEKTFLILSKELFIAQKKKDYARINMHERIIRALFESLQNNAIAIELVANKKLDRINEKEEMLVMQGAENLLSIIAHQNEALKAAIGMTKYIPNKTKKK